MSEYKRYIVGLTEKLPPEDRDKFRKLSAPETWMEVKDRDVGEHVVWAIEANEKDLRLIKSSKNVKYVYEDLPGSRKPINSDSPPENAIRWHNALSALQWGFNGSGVIVGVIDDGMHAPVASLFRDKISKSWLGTDPFNSQDTRPDGTHADMTCPLAVPPGSRLSLAEASPANTTASGSAIDFTAAIYWQVDTAGAHVIVPEAQFKTSYQPMTDAIAYAWAQGVPAFCPAGNGGADDVGDGENIVVYPAGDPGALAIGNWDSVLDAQDTGSNYGSHIWSWSVGNPTTSYLPDGSFQTIDYGGTSAAAPVAAHMYATLLTKCPCKTPAQIIQVMADTMTADLLIDWEAAAWKLAA